MSAIADTVINRLKEGSRTRPELHLVVSRHVAQPELSAAATTLAGVRLVFVNRYYYPDMSATSQMLTDLARNLVRQGADVSVVCSCQLYDDPRAVLPAEEVVDGVHIHRVKTTRFGRNKLSGRAIDYLSFYVAAASKLIGVVRKGDVLIAKTDPPMISVVAALVARLRGASLVNWLQDLFPEVASHLGKRLPNPVERLLLALRDLSLRAAHANVVIGSRMKDKLLQRGVNSAGIHIIENWSDGVMAMPASASVVRVSLGLQNKFVVGYSGNLGRAHEIETILGAARALHNEPDVVFLMVGGGVNMQRLNEAVAEERLANFIFMPYQPRELLADSLAAADVHLISLLPQLEGLIVPSKFYGILAAGRPAIVIGDTDGELARAVRSHHCGEAVLPGDWDALVSAIWCLKTEPEYRARLGHRAMHVFAERHTATHAALKWSGMLSSVHHVKRGYLLRIEAVKA